MKIIYKQLKTNNIIVTIVVLLSFITTSISVFLMYKAYDNSNKIMYVVTDNGIVAPLNRIEKKEDQIVLVQGAIANFIDKYYTLDQFNYKKKAEKVLWLASEDFVQMFKDKQAKGYFNRFVQTGVVQKAELIQESLKISSYDAPWQVQYDVMIETHNGGNTKQVILTNTATLYKVDLNYPYNPFGVLYTNFVESNIREYNPNL